MAVKRPTPAQLRDIGAELGIDLSDADLEAYLPLVQSWLGGYDVLDEIPDYLPEVKYPRKPGYRPEGEENKYNAWITKCHIKGRNRGKLTGKKVALKDTVCVAGVPMMNGASVLEGYVPDVDATIVTRLLDAGAEIVGKSNTESYSYSGSSHTSATGYVQNPHKMGYNAGGSSSGSGALVAAGEVDMAIGCDQAGSLRIPASACGNYGMKQTYGLVPYTGILSQEFNVDHAGPMTASVANNALFLEVLAGRDGIDPRQGDVKVAKYTNALKESAKGLKIGVLKEGFGFPESEADVDAKVKAAARKFTRLGVKVEEVSLPIHRLGVNIWMAFGMEGYLNNVLKGNAFGTNHGGLFVTSLNDAMAGWRARANEFPHHFKLGALAGQYMSRYYHGHYYCKAMNLARKLRDTYNKALETYDLLLCPTYTVKPKRLPKRDISAAEYVTRAFEGCQNTMPFNLSKHPVMTVPCGKINGLPVGMSLVGRHFDEYTIYRAARAFEKLGDWQKM